MFILKNAAVFDEKWKIAILTHYNITTSMDLDWILLKIQLYY